MEWRAEKFPLKHAIGVAWLSLDELRQMGTHGTVKTMVIMKC